MPMNNEERMDDLLASALAHRAVLEELVRRLIPNPKDRRSAAQRTCEAFEKLGEMKEATARSHLLGQKAMAEIEQIFRGPPSPPE